jgi:hypothetical protein
LLTAAPWRTRREYIVLLDKVEVAKYIVVTVSPGADQPSGSSAGPRAKAWWQARLAIANKWLQGGEEADVRGGRECKVGPAPGSTLPSPAHRPPSAPPAATLGKLGGESDAGGAPVVHIPKVKRGKGVGTPPLQAAGNAAPAGGARSHNVDDVAIVDAVAPAALASGEAKVVIPEEIRQKLRSGAMSELDDDELDLLLRHKRQWQLARKTEPTRG